jgi:hypothetical protein
MAPLPSAAPMVCSVAQDVDTADGIIFTAGSTLRMESTGGRFPEMVRLPTFRSGRSQLSVWKEAHL